MHKPLLLALALAVAGGPKVARADTAGSAPEDTAYLFTYFTKNGEDGLHLAWSRDGYHWEALGGGASYLAPAVGKEKLIRDPCVTCGPDGLYRMVWTCGWRENGIGYASTRDFVHWSKQQEIPVMAAEPRVRNCWAPEIDYDAKRGDYLIFWASTVTGKFPQTAGSSESDYNHRIYATTTRDFVTFTPTRLFYDPGFSVIDATILPADGRFYLIVKDETVKPPKKHLRIASSDDLAGPYTDLGPPFTPPGLWVEGPTAIRIGGDYLVYFDAYIAKHYGAMRSRDLTTWEDVTSRMTFPGAGTPLRMRHGTVIAVPAALIAQLRAAGS
jgi:Arabinosidase BT_3657-like, N-terminal